MTIPEKQIYPRTGDRRTVYLKNVVANPNITVGDYTMYNDFRDDPTLFEQNNVLYHYPVNHDRLIIGKFCSIACGARFLFNSANHTLTSLSTYTFFMRNGDWTGRTSPALGTTRATSSLAMTSGLAMRQWCLPALRSETALS